MAASKASIMVMAVMIVNVAAGLFQGVSAVTHTVTWTFGQNATQYDEWAGQQAFRVGDEIAFMYGAAHNVFEVSKSDLDNCNTNSPINKYESPNAVVALSRPGYFGFICAIGSHCSQGNMKMNVEVLAATTSSPSPMPLECTDECPHGPATAPPSGSDGSSLQSLPSMIVGALVAACAALLF